MTLSSLKETENNHEGRVVEGYEKDRNRFKNSLELTEQHFKLSGDTAVFRYVYTRTRQDAAFEIHQHIRRTAVYQRNGTHWQLIQSASVALPNADRKQKLVDAKILDRYVGLYEGNLKDDARRQSNSVSRSL